MNILEGGESMAYNEFDLENGIPKEGAIDEMESLLKDDYEALLRETIGSFGDDMKNIMPDDELLSLEDLFSGSEDFLKVETTSEIPLPNEGPTNIPIPETVTPQRSEVKSTSDIFSESLSAVSSLEDDLLEQQITDMLPENVNGGKEDSQELNVLQKMFANVPVEDTRQPEVDEEEKRKKKEEKKQEKKQKKLEQKRLKIEEKKRKKKEKLQARAEIKEKKHKAKLSLIEAQKSMPPEGKINPVGASVVFGLSAIVLLTILILCKSYTYDINVESARNSMAIKRYSEAYQTLNGIKLKPKDQLIYNQVETIMYVYTHKESYQNYLKIQMEVEALDSLIKGVDRYNLFYEKATNLGVDEEYDELKKEFVYELSDKYDLSEQEAKTLYALEDSKEYTKKLMEIVESHSEEQEGSTLVGKLVVE